MDRSRHTRMVRGTDPKVVAAMVALTAATVSACGADKPEPAPEPTPVMAGVAPEWRLVAPLSTSIATTQRPLFRWKQPGHTRVTLEICRDRACADPIAHVETDQSSARQQRRCQPAWCSGA